MDVSIEDQIKEAMLELKKKRDIFPRWVREGRLIESVAVRRIDAQAAIVETLESVRNSRANVQERLWEDTE